jgi:hypothetical protein
MVLTRHIRRRGCWEMWFIDSGRRVAGDDIYRSWTVHMSGPSPTGKAMRKVIDVIVGARLSMRKARSRGKRIGANGLRGEGGLMWDRDAGGIFLIGPS